MSQFDLTKINPAKNEKYSQNLYKWLAREKKQSPELFKTLGFFKHKNGSIYIGHVVDRWFRGVQLNSVLCQGLRAKVGCYSTSPDNWKPMKTMLAKYERIGRCAFDKAHERYFLNSNSRWEVAGKKRHCNWCGNHSQRMVTKVIMNTVTKWVPIKKRVSA